MVSVFVLDIDSKLESDSDIEDSAQDLAKSKADFFKQFLSKELHIM